MTTTTTRTAAGFIVIANDMTAIYATGASERAARRDYERATNNAWGNGSERCVPATARLIRAVRTHGGSPRDVRWDLVGGIADRA